MSGKAETWSERLAAASAEAAAVEGHVPTPIIEDDDIERALEVASAGRTQGAERGGKRQTGLLAVPTPQPPGPTSNANKQAQAPTVAPRNQAATPEIDTPPGSALQEAAQEFVRRHHLARALPRDTIEFARQRKGPDFADAVRIAIDERSQPRTHYAIHAEAKQFAQRRRKEAGLKTIWIENLDERLRDAVKSMVLQLDSVEGRLSASAAARLPGLDSRQAKKLAERIQVPSAAVSAGICLLPKSPFVRWLQENPGLFATATIDAVSLTKLGKALDGLHWTMIKGLVQTQATRQLPQSSRGTMARRRNVRGAWHAEAAQLKAQNVPIAQIAQALGRTPNAVQKALARCASPTSAL